MATAQDARFESGLLRFAATTPPQDREFAMKTILIVDDEPAARYGLRRALESKYRVAEADSAEAAGPAIETEKPDLVLLDVVLPGLDGVSFLKSLRDQGNDVPVLMVSA